MKISSCACFLIISGVLFFIYRISMSSNCRRRPLGYPNPWDDNKTITIIFPNPGCQCLFRDISGYPLKMKTPSLESFIQASTAMEDQDPRLSGLAVFANACQPLADVSKAKIQVNKIALVSLANGATCPLQGLVEHAQNAGYSLMRFLDDLNPHRFDQGTPLQKQTTDSGVNKRSSWLSLP